MRHEEALRIHSLCKVLRKMDILQEVLCLAHKRSLGKYLEIDHEEDFFETADAPDIHRKPASQPGGGKRGPLLAATSRIPTLGVSPIRLSGGYF